MTDTEKTEFIAVNLNKAQHKLSELNSYLYWQENFYAKRTLMGRIKLKIYRFIFETLFEKQAQICEEIANLVLPTYSFLSVEKEYLETIKRISKWERWYSQNNCREHRRTEEHRKWK